MTRLPIALALVCLAACEADPGEGSALDAGADGALVCEEPTPIELLQSCDVIECPGADYAGPGPDGDHTFRCEWACGDLGEFNPEVALEAEWIRGESCWVRTWVVLSAARCCEAGDAGAGGAR
jgi:hypothetical protein